MGSRDRMAEMRMRDDTATVMLEEVATSATTVQAGIVPDLETQVTIAVVTMLTGPALGTQAMIDAITPIVPRGNLTVIVMLVLGVRTEGSTTSTLVVNVAVVRTVIPTTTGADLPIGPGTTAKEAEVLLARQTLKGMKGARAGVGVDRLAGQSRFDEGPGRYAPRNGSTRGDNDSDFSINMNRDIPSTEPLVDSPRRVPTNKTGGRLNTRPTNGSAAGGPAEEQQNGASLPDFLNSIGSIQQDCDRISDGIKKIKSLQSRIIGSTVADEVTSLNRQLDRANDQTSGLLSSVRKRLKALSAETGSMKATTEKQTRQMQQSTVARRLLEIADEYQSCQSTFKQRYKQRVAREIKNARPDATPAEIERALDGNIGSAFSQQLLSSRSAQSRRVLEEVQTRQEALAKLESSMTELVTLFQEMQALLEVQQEVINEVEVHVDNTVQYIEDGSKEMTKAIGSARSARKFKVWILIIVLVVLVIAAVVVYIEDQKKQLARRFILSSPPGEVNDVFNDVRVLLDDDDLLQEAVSEPFREYNTENFLNVKPPDADHDMLITTFGEIEPGRYVDPRSRQSFEFDHVRQVLSNAAPYEADEETEPFRVAVESAVAAYVEDHFADGLFAVYGLPGKTVTVAIVDNKYNPNNFWNGRWTSHWTASADAAAVNGVAKINVHYYEDGNVQLRTTKEAKLTLPTIPSEPEAFAKALVKLIGQAESQFQLALNESYAQLSDSMFKSLRRALPITRSKVDWNAISNYKIGAELANK
ncbi:F-actin-capping protein [Cladochytrium tenue]|nr:F-actin-capping protein [Cladochytrium tenue]